MPIRTVRNIGGRDGEEGEKGCAIENCCAVSSACGHTEGICFFTKQSAEPLAWPWFWTGWEDRRESECGLETGSIFWCSWQDGRG